MTPRIVAASALAVWSLYTLIRNALALVPQWASTLDDDPTMGSLHGLWLTQSSVSVALALGLLIVGPALVRGLVLAGHPRVSAWTWAALVPCGLATLAGYLPDVVGLLAFPEAFGPELEASHEPLWTLAALTAAVIVLLLAYRARGRSGEEDEPTGTADVLRLGVWGLGIFLGVQTVATIAEIVVMEVEDGMVLGLSPLMIYGTLAVSAGVSLLLLCRSARIAELLLRGNRCLGRDAPVRSQALGAFGLGLVGFTATLHAVGWGANAAVEFSGFSSAPPSNAAWAWWATGALVAALGALPGPARIVRALRGLPSRPPAEDASTGTCADCALVLMAGAGLWFGLQALTMLFDQSLVINDEGFGWLDPGGGLGWFAVLVAASACLLALSMRGGWRRNPFFGVGRRVFGWLVLALALPSAAVALRSWIESDMQRQVPVPPGSLSPATWGGLVVMLLTAVILLNWPCLRTLARASKARSTPGPS